MLISQRRLRTHLISAKYTTILRYSASVVLRETIFFLFEAHNIGLSPIYTSQKWIFNHLVGSPINIGKGKYGEAWRRLK